VVPIITSAQISYLLKLIVVKRPQSPGSTVSIKLQLVLV